jgi:hypothetical protein
MMRRFFLVLFFSVLALLPAQERSNTTIYVSPTTGGTPEARKFFDDNIPMEIQGANYRQVYTAREADYILNMQVSEVEDVDNPGEFYNLFTVGITRAKTNVVVVDFSWEYSDLEEMHNWNLYLIYNALANITLTNAPSGPPGPWWDYWLYFGFRAGPVITGYSFQTTVAGYESGYSASFGIEGGFTAEFRLFRYLFLQVDALFSYDSFNTARVVSDGGVWSRRTDRFTGMSLLFPVLFKLPVPFEKTILSFYVGTYFSAFPLPLKRTSSGISETITIAEVLPPMGFAAGVDLAFNVGPGELAADFRYYRDFGTTVVHKDNGPRYTRDRMVLSVSYKFPLFKHNPPSPKPENPPVEEEL